MSGKNKQLSREEGWRFQYRIRPYLATTPAEDLRQRTADILRNLYTLTPEGKVGALTPEDGGLFWLQMFSDVALEYYRRNENVEPQVKPEDIPFNRTALELVRSNRNLARHMLKRPIFCRYGQLKWMTALREQGMLLLSPASYYRALGGDIARQDNELVLQTCVSPYDYDLGLVDSSVTALLPNRSWGIFEHRKPCDHYLYCVTVSFDFRYFLDFGSTGYPAEACVLIHNQQEFEKRLVRAVRVALPDWYVSFGSVKYIDPYFVLQVLPNAGDKIFYFKHFRFMYQREHRLVALPPVGVEGPFDRLRITLGSIADISDLFILRAAD